MDHRLALLLAIGLAMPLASAQEQVGYVMGISVVGAPLLHAPVGETTEVRVQVFNGDPTQAKTIRVGVTEFTHLADHAGAGEGLSARNADSVVTVPASGEVEWILELMPTGEGSRWRVTIGTSDDPQAALSPITSFEVETSRTLWNDAATLASWGAGGAAFGGLVGLLIVRPGLRGALALPFLGLYTRIRRSDALSQENRERIYAAVRAHPGVGYAELMRETKLGSGVLVHHLRILEREKLVVSRRQGLRRQLFAAGEARNAEDGPSEAQARVLAALRAAPLTQRELRELLSLSQQGVSYHIQNLAREGRIREEQDGRDRRWRAVDGTSSG